MKKNSFFKNIKVVDVSLTGMVLAIMMVTKYIQSFIPDLPNGLGDISVLMEVIIIAGSFIVGWKIVLSATIIYLLLGLISIPTFFGGLLYVNSNVTKIEVYFLDYFLPLITLTIAGILKNWSAYVFVPALVFINYIFHVLSGIIFWGSYAWKGYGAVAYAFAANAIRNGTMLGFSLIIIYPSISLNNAISGRL